MLYWLDHKDIRFPAIDSALEEPNGLLAAGGDLRPERLLEAYRQGIFPWYEEGQPILWWSPNPRAVLLPGDIHLSRSLKKTMRQQKFTVTADTAFAEVIAACGELTEQRTGTWITSEMEAAYTTLYQQGIAHSIEVWLENHLVGGLYGLGIGQLFFGESMFSRVTNASKVAFVHLANQLQCWEFKLIDCQVPNDHLTRLGATTIPRSEFKDYLIKYLDKPAPSSPWHLSWQF